MSSPLGAAQQPDSRDPERRPQGAVLLLAVMDDSCIEGENFVGSARPRLQTLVRAPTEHRHSTANAPDRLPSRRLDCAGSLESPDWTWARHSRRIDAPIEPEADARTRTGAL